MEKSYGRLTAACSNFGPAVGGCGNHVMAVGRGGQGKVQPQRPLTYTEGEFLRADHIPLALLPSRRTLGTALPRPGPSKDRLPRTI